MGVLLTRSYPARAEWPQGSLEFEGADRELPRRLVLRAFRSAPGHGVMFALIRPELVAITNGCLRLRGVEAYESGGDKRGAMIQDWLVEVCA